MQEVMDIFGLNLEGIMGGMDMGTFTSQLQGILFNQTDESHAKMLSSEWKRKAETCKLDLEQIIKKQEKHLGKIVDEGDGDAIETAFHRLDESRHYLSQIIQLLQDTGRYPISMEFVETISECEKFLYKQVMTPQIFQKITQEIQTEDQNQESINELTAKVDRMWDNGDSEEAIKEVISNEFQRMYPNFNETQIRNLTLQFFVWANEGKNVRINLSEQQIGQLPRENYKGGDERCATCLEDFNLNDETIVLPCDGKHRFHPDCIVPWLKMSVACPMCKTDIREKI